MKIYRAALAAILFATAHGCGPTVGLMTPRLTPEQYQQVDQVWDNMMTPVDRLDHGLLLDVVAAYSLHQLGVDTLHMTAEKRLAKGRVIITIDCNRASPDTDAVTLTVLDASGKTLRRERFGRSEVEAAWNSLGTFETVEDPRPTAAPESPEQREQRLAREAQRSEQRLAREVRRKQIEAATQPVGSKP